MKIGDKVQWTHRYRKGSSIHFTTWKGVIVKEFEGFGIFYVYRRGKLYGLRASELKPLGQTSELTATVMNIGKAVNMNNCEKSWNLKNVIDPGYVIANVPVRINTKGCLYCRFESMYNCLLFEKKVANLERCQQCVEAVEKAKKEAK